MKELELLNRATVQGHVVKLPLGQLEKSLFTKVATKLQRIGGQWKGGKTKGFVFKEDPTELLQQIQGGAFINLKQPYPFFPTPPALADKLVGLAEIYSDDQVLEPSAGVGDLIAAVHRTHPDLCVDYCELMPVNLTELASMTNTRKVGEDFLEYTPGELYDIIIAHPPFPKSQDIDHICHMYKLLKPGGRLVSIASTYWDQNDNKQKEKRFKHWLIGKGASIEYLPAGSFKKSSTSVACCIITITKPVTHAR